MVDDVVLGKIAAAGYAAYPIVLRSARGATRPPWIATSVVEDREHRLSYVLARVGSGVRFPSGAAGRRIGILPTVAYNCWLEEILAAAGVDRDTVDVVPLEPSLQAQAILQGTVDLLFTNDPMASAMLGSGKVEIADDGPPCARWLGDPFPFGGFVLSAALVEEQPWVARGLVEAVEEAIGEVRRDPVAARRAMLTYVRPDERAFVDQYPDSRYLTSAELPASWLSDEVARERKLGILQPDAGSEAGGSPSVRAWPQGPGG